MLGPDGRIGHVEVELGAVAELGRRPIGATSDGLRPAVLGE